MPYHKKSPPEGDECKSRASLGARSEAPEEGDGHESPAGIWSCDCGEAPVLYSRRGGKAGNSFPPRQDLMLVGLAEGKVWGQRPALLTCPWWCPKSSSACGEGTGDSSALLFLSGLSFLWEWWGPARQRPGWVATGVFGVCQPLQSPQLTKPLPPRGTLAPHQKPVCPASVPTALFHGINSFLSGRTLGCVRAFASGSLAESCFGNLRLNFCAWVGRSGAAGGGCWLSLVPSSSPQQAVLPWARHAGLFHAGQGTEAQAQG